MVVDRKTERFLGSYEKERDKLAKQEARLQVSRKALARALAASDEKQEKWHRFKLAYADRQAGFEGSHADARDELRQLPVYDYCRRVIDGIAEGSKTTLVEAELIAVKSDFEKLTAAANARYLARDEASYLEVLTKWREHDRANPNDGGWRAKAATREQWLLIARVVAAKAIEGPAAKITRGEAHDWIEANGGNPRYGEDGQTAPIVNPSGGQNSGAAIARMDTES